MDKTIAGSGRVNPAPRDGSSSAGASPAKKGVEARVRVHDHDEHMFEPSPALPVKPKPFVPSKHRYLPIAVPVIMVGNIVVFILMMYWNNCPNHIEPGRKCVASWMKPLSFQPWRENPMLGPRTAAILKWGGLESNLVVNGGEAWRLISAVALNGGVLQLIFNLLVLLIVGTRMEFTFWFTKVSAVYAISGFGGSILSALFIQNQIFAGAGGAIMGLIGAGFADMFINWPVTERKIFKLIDLTLFLLISLGFGLMPQVDNFANVGGLLTGFLLGLILLKRPQKGYKDTRHLSQLEAFMVNNEDPDLPPVPMYRISQRVVSLMALLFLTALLATGLIFLFWERANNIRVNKSCSWCHYAACVPNLKWECPGIYRNP
jgi:membrane associated rhomboid family serine protease